MFRFLNTLFASDLSPGRTDGRAPKARLGLEALEDRRTPGSGSFADGGSFSSSGGSSSTSSTPPPTTTVVTVSDTSTASYTWQERIWAG